MAEHLTPSGRAGIIVPRRHHLPEPEGPHPTSQDTRRELSGSRRLAPRRASSSPTPALRPPSSYSTSPSQRGQTASPSSRSKTTASTSATSASPSTGTTCHRVQAEITEYLSRLRAGKTVAGIAESSAEYTTGEFTDGSQPQARPDSREGEGRRRRQLWAERRAVSAEWHERDDAYPNGLSLGEVCILGKPSVWFRGSQSFLRRTLVSRYVPNHRPHRQR